MRDHWLRWVGRWGMYAAAYAIRASLGSASYPEPSACTWRA
ncbi:hypothetical protein [Streptomyces sp. NPDC021622]